MIQANELRIGNWVRIEFEELCTGADAQVTGISSYISTKCKYGTQNNDLGVDLEPIPITEEILLKYDFEVAESTDKYGGWVSKDGLRIVKQGQEFGFILSMWTFIPIPYLHTLQNFHFAIKKTELEITL